MDLSIHQYFYVFFSKIWLNVYFKGRVGMILVVQVKDIKTFHKLPQNEALCKYKTHSCGLLRLWWTFEPGFYITHQRPCNTQGCAYGTVQSASGLTFQKHLPSSYLINTSSLQSHASRSLFSCRLLHNICSADNFSPELPSPFLSLPYALKNF